MLYQQYVIKLHSIEKRHAGDGEVIGHQLIDSSGSTSMDDNASCYNDHQMIHNLNELCHFVPILHKVPTPNKSIYIYVRLGLQLTVRTLLYVVPIYLSE